MFYNYITVIVAQVSSANVLKPVNCIHFQWVNIKVCEWYLNREGIYLFIKRWARESKRGRREVLL